MDQARNLVSNFDATAGKSQNNANSMDVESVGSGGGSTSTSTSNSNSNITSNTISHNNSQPPQAVKADVTPLITPNVPGIYTNDTSNKKGKLRKGKWTIEEEEYTSRIIQYFSTGLLTLPDGATLRSYLAEKLNCDPMRITKKFTGACCLGRRAYHLRDRPRASSAEVEMANYELLHLEQRFRLRVEHEQTGLPLPPRHELLPSQPPPRPTPIISADVLPSLFSLQQQQRQGSETPAVNANKNPWIQQNSTTLHPTLASLLPGLTGNIANVTLPGLNLNNAHAANISPSLPLSSVAQQLLLQQKSNEREQSSFSTPAASSSSQLQVLNNVIASLAFSKALACQHTGLAQLQSYTTDMTPGNNMDAIAAATAAKTSNNSIYATTPSSTSSFSTNIAINKSSMSMPIIGSQKDHSEQVEIYQKQLEKKNKSFSTSSLTKEERTKQLKAAFEEQQKALRLAYEKSLRDAQEEETFAPTPAAIASSHSKGETSTVSTNNFTGSKILSNVTSPAEQLQRSYEAHLASLRRDERQEPSTRTLPEPPHSKTYAMTERRGEIEGKGPKSQNNKDQEKDQRIQEKTPDEEAGTILLGFLNSLRESFEDAVEAKNGTKTTNGRNDCNNKNQNNNATNTAAELIQTANKIEPPKVVTEDVNSISSHRNHVNSHTSKNVRNLGPNPITSLSHFQSSKRKIKPASVTETSSSTSSQPTIDQSSSSQEDSKSDRMGNSSSEESSERGSTTSRRASKGPPRKRLKGLVEHHEFTRENLMAHSKRMDMECEESASSSSCDE